MTKAFRQAAPVLGALALGSAGLQFHNLREFSIVVLVRGDTLVLLAAYVGPGAWWWRSPGAWSRRALLGWGLLHLLGGGLIVGGGVPRVVVDLLRGDPSYNLPHHVNHWVHGLAHVPPLWTAGRKDRGAR